MIKLKAGQLCTINHTVYRAKARTGAHFLDCTGCALNNPIVCPNVSFANCENKIAINCEDARIILQRV